MRSDLRTIFPQPVTLLHAFTIRTGKAILGQLDTQVWACSSGSSILCLLFLAHRYEKASLCNYVIREKLPFLIDFFFLNVAWLPRAEGIRYKTGGSGNLEFKIN